MRDRSVLLHAVGDIALGDHPLCAGFGTHSRARTRPAGFPFERAAPLLDGADVLFGNLECTLSEAGIRPGDYHSVQMRGDAHYVAGLKQAGFAVVNLANNHSLQHGPASFKETAEMLRRAGIGTCGVSGDDFRSSVPELVERNGVRIAFLGYSLRPRQYFTEEPIYAEGHRDVLLNDVRSARATADCVVVSLHWGDEFIDRASPAERRLAHDIMDAGADLIVGHHPHVLRGVERYGRGYIVYSLGNFVCDMLWDETLRETAVLQCRLTPAGVSDLKLMPARINDEYQPTPLDGTAAQALCSRIAEMSMRLQSGDTEAESADEYRLAADAAQRQARRKSHMYFLRKAYRFPPGMVVQQVGTFFRNRLAERGIGSPDRTAPGC